MHTHIHITTYIHACMHTCILSYIHTYIHTYVHTYIHTYIHTECQEAELGVAQDNQIYGPLNLLEQYHSGLSDQDPGQRRTQAPARTRARESASFVLQVSPALSNYPQMNYKYHQTGAMRF